MTELRDAIVAAYIAGATDVHNNWQEDRDPCFKEAAYDYADAQGMSASGQDPKGLEAKPASPVAESDAPND